MGPLLLLVALSAQVPASDVAAEAPAPDPSAPPVEAAVEKEPRLQLLRVAVYDLEVAEIDPKVQRVVTDSVIIELRKLQNVNVVGMAEIQAMLDHESEKAIMGCADESCLADIAGALGVDVLVIGSMAKVGDEHVLALRRVDQRAAEVAGTYQKRLAAGDGEEFLAAVGPAVEALFPEVPLREGKTRGVDETVALRLNPPPLAPAVFYSLLAGSGVSLLGAAGAGVANLGLYLAYMVYRDSGKGENAQPVSFSTLSTLAIGSNVAMIAGLGLGVTGVVVGAGAGVSALFTDFEGYGDEVSE